MCMHILTAATATVRPQAEVPVDGTFEFQAVHYLPTAALPSGLYQPAPSIFHLMKVITANMYMYKCVCVCVCVYIYIYTHTHTHTTRMVRQDGDA